MRSESGSPLSVLKEAILLVSVISFVLLIGTVAVALFDEFVFILTEDALFLTLFCCILIYASLFFAIFGHLTLKLKVEQRRQQIRWKWMRSESGPPSSFLKKVSSFLELEKYYHNLLKKYHNLSKKKIICRKKNLVC